MIYVVIIFVIFVGELYIKNKVEASETLDEKGKRVAGGVILRKYHNEGAFLDFGEKKRFIVMLVSLGITIFLTILFVCSFTARGSVLLKTGYALLLGGAFSNTYDRMRRKYVVDYVSFGVRHPKLKAIVFNISDFCIMIGAACMVLASMKK